MNIACALMLGLCASAAPDGPARVEAFSPGDVAGEYRIETALLRGLLGAGGASLGLYPLEYASGPIAVAGPMGLLNYYRVFTVNRRYGESMRALPSETTLEAPDTLRVHWPASDDRPFTLTGVYRWTKPGMLDLETIVEAGAELPMFDVFLASYLAPAFPVSSVYVKTEGGKAAFAAAETADGVWQVFPRDAAALEWVKDGRWDIDPSAVDWAVRPEFAAPLIYRRHEGSGLTVALMARPEDCFAVFTPHRGETHYSMYFSLFGRTLRAGQTVSARVRLIVGEFDDAALSAHYREFLDAYPAR